MYYTNDEDREEQEPREIETFTVEAGPCVVCGRPGQRHACFRCGKPVCYNTSDYFGDSTCGGWILDSWHPAHPDGNEMWCHVCQASGQVTDLGSGELETAAGLAFKYKENKDGSKVLTIKMQGKPVDLTEEETRTLVAYLWTEKASDLFGKQYDPDEASDTEPELVAVGEDLGELPDHPF